MEEGHSMEESVKEQHEMEQTGQEDIREQAQGSQSDRHDMGQTTQESRSDRHDMGRTTQESRSDRHDMGQTTQESRSDRHEMGQTIQGSQSDRHDMGRTTKGSIERQQMGNADGLFTGILETFGNEAFLKGDIRTYSPLTLAYMGDAVYDLIIRTVVVGHANRPANDLHRLTVKYVSANAQSKIVQALMDSLTEDELAVYRRGKNAKPHTTAKNASYADYMRATGFEAVIGYLYLTGNMQRALELVKMGTALISAGNEGE